MMPLICLSYERIVALPIKTLCTRMNNSMLESLGRLRTTFTALSTVVFNGTFDVTGRGITNTFIG